MANPAFEDYESTVWAALVETITAETNIGAGGAGTGTNPTGRLQTCADVRSSIHLWTGHLPAIGVQSLGWDATRYSTQFDILPINFQIVVAANSVDSGSTPPNLDAANAALQPLISDGAGNGLGNILRDPENWALKQFASGISIVETWLSKLMRDWELRPGESPQIWSYGFYTYTVKVRVYTGSGG